MLASPLSSAASSTVTTPRGSEKKENPPPSVSSPLLGRVDENSCCCTNRLTFQIVFIAGVALTVLGLSMLCSLSIQNGGALTSAINSMRNFTTSFAQSIGTDPLTLSAFITSIGGTLFLGGIAGWAVDCCNKGKPKDMLLPEPKAIESKEFNVMLAAVKTQLTAQVDQVLKEQEKDLTSQITAQNTTIQTHTDNIQALQTELSDLSKRVDSLSQPQKKRRHSESDLINPRSLSASFEEIPPSSSPPSPATEEKSSSAPASSESSASSTSSSSSTPSPQSSADQVKKI